VIDTNDLKERVDLGALVERDLGPPSRRSGQWLFWHCPFHEDRDPSFAVTPDRDRYHCFGCGASGDAISWLGQREGLSFLDACERLGGLDLPSRPVHVASPAADDTPPPAAWQERAAAFAADCEAVLWSDTGARALAYLRDKRGLNDATIRYWHLGYNRADRYEKPEAWGLDAGAGKVWLPRGVVIPCQVGGVRWYGKIRRPAGKPKYVSVKGGRATLFGADLVAGWPVVLLCEGEFDAVLLHQQAGDLAGVAALGSASRRTLSDSWVQQLLGARRILVACDTDDPGEKGAAWLLLQSRRMRRVRPLRGNDLTDFYQAGGDLRAWVVDLLARLEVEAGALYERAADAARGIWSAEVSRAGELLAVARPEASWAREWAALAERAGWPCWGMSWGEWAEDVARVVRGQVDATAAEQAGGLQQLAITGI